MMMSELAGNDKGIPTATDEVGSESFGDWLRRQREGREIELREIADSSKISLRYLQAFEDNRFDLLPSEIFAKGFLRQYAKYVGLDPEEAVTFLLASIPEKETPDPNPSLGKRSSFGLVWLLVLAILALAFVWFLSGSKEEPTRPEIGDSSSTDVPRSDLSDLAGKIVAVDIGTPADTIGVEAPEERVEEEAVERPIDALNAVLDFSGECWVEAKIDGDSAIAETKVQGESLSFSANETIELKLGNTGSVELAVNGVPIRLNPPGSVQTLRFDRDFLARFEPDPTPKAATSTE